MPAQPSTTGLAGQRVLVTGAGGYLGGALVGQLLGAGASVRRLVRRAGGGAGGAGSDFPAGMNVEDVVGDVRDASLWPSLLEGAAIVVHLAAQTSAYLAEDDPAADRAINVEPLLAMLETCRRSGRRPAILLAGTVTQAGMTERLPVDESVPDAPVTIYDLHKLVAEQSLETYVRGGFVRGACLRLANVYGPGAGSVSPDRGVLNKMVQRAVRGETLPLYGSGDHMRDYVYIDDAAGAFLAAAVQIDRVEGRHFVIGSGRGRTVAEAVAYVSERVAARTGVRAPIARAEPPRPLLRIEERHFVADAGAFRGATGWSPSTGFEQGIDRTIDWCLARQGAPR